MHLIRPLKNGGQMTTIEYRGHALEFGSSAVAATVLNNAVDHEIPGRSIVVNLAGADAWIPGDQPTTLPALQSTTIVNARVSGQRLAVFAVSDAAAVAHDARISWLDFYGSRGAAGDHPELLKSVQLSAGRVELDRSSILRQPELPTGTSQFEVLLNLWFSPSGTSCGIHNEHDFIEVHTQLSGLGRMQKFRAKATETLYEEYLTPVGTTNPPTFCRQYGTEFRYPWHQYFADTDCVWLAVEYHSR